MITEKQLADDDDDDDDDYDDEDDDDGLAFDSTIQVNKRDFKRCSTSNFKPF